MSSIELIKADLNNDGTTEYLVTSPAFCGTGGCSYTIYAYSDFFERYGVAGSTNQSCYEWRNCFKEPIKGKIEPYGEKDFKWFMAVAINELTLNKSRLKVSVAIPKSRDFVEKFKMLPTGDNELVEFVKARLQIAEIEASRVVEDFTGFDWSKLAKESPHEFKNTKLFVDQYKDKMEDIKRLKKDLNKRYDLRKTSDFSEAYNRTILISQEVVDSFSDFDWFDKDTTNKVISDNYTFFRKYIERLKSLYVSLDENKDSFDINPKLTGNPPEPDISDITNINNINLDEIMPTIYWVIYGMVFKDGEHSSFENGEYKVLTEINDKEKLYSDYRYAINKTNSIGIMRYFDGDSSRHMDNPSYVAFFGHPLSHHKLLLIPTEIELGAFCAKHDIDLNQWHAMNVD